MKAEELRLGNIVRVSDSGEIVRVERITRKKVGFFHGNDRSRGYFRRLSELEPVLIHEVHCSLPPLPELVWADKALCEDLYYYGRMPIVNLHELQNLHYALTGNEIEIEI